MRSSARTGVDADLYGELNRRVASGETFRERLRTLVQSAAARVRHRAMRPFRAVEERIGMFVHTLRPQRISQRTPQYAEPPVSKLDLADLERRTIARIEQLFDEQQRKD